MHIQIVNFNLENMTYDEYTSLCDEVAQAFAEVPGLISQVWLSDQDANTFGGVYTWQDRQAMETFTQSELFSNVAGNPNLVNITSKDFGILEGPTAVTNGLS